MHMFGNSFEGCVYLGSPLACGGLYRWVGVCESFCLHLHVITSEYENTTLVSPYVFLGCVLQLVLTTE